MIFVSSDLYIFFFRHDVRHWNWSQGLPQRDATLTIIHPRDANEWKMTVHLGENKLLQSVCIATNNLSNPDYFSVYKLFWIGKVWVLSPKRLKKKEFFALLPCYQTKKVEKCQPDAVAAFSSWHWHRCSTTTCDPDSANQVFRNCKSSSQISPQQSHLPFHHTDCCYHCCSCHTLKPFLKKSQLAWQPALASSPRRLTLETSPGQQHFFMRHQPDFQEVSGAKYRRHLYHQIFSDPNIFLVVARFLLATIRCM